MEKDQPISSIKQEHYKMRQQEKLNKQKYKKQRRLYRRIFLWFAVTFIISGAIFGIVQIVQQPVGTGEVVSISSVDVVSNNDWIKGKEGSDIVLIEYSDFQCPACGSYYPIVKEISRVFERDIQFVYRNFPLRQVHRNSQLAGQAAEAAGRQGKFWEMHDMIFENQNKWSSQKREQAEEIFVSYANVLDIDIKRFKEDLFSKKVRDKVNNDYQSGIKAGVNSTPTFFLNGKKIQNPRNYEDFKSIIKQAIDSTF